MNSTFSDRPPCSGGTHQEELVNYFVDGVLSADGQVELFEHLASCEGCRDDLDAVMTFRRMSRLEYIHVPPSIDDAFFQKLAARRIPSSAEKDTDRSILSANIPLSLRSLLVAACVFFAVGLVVPSNISTAETKIVETRQEAVSLAGTSINPAPREAVYVFYPGLTITADQTLSEVEAQ